MDSKVDNMPVQRRVRHQMLEEVEDDVKSDIEIKINAANNDLK